MSYNGYTKNTVAWEIYQEFVSLDQSLESIKDEVDLAATTACNEIEDLENSITELQEDYDGLQLRFNELRAAGGTEELMRILRNIRMYADAAITKQETADGTINKEEEKVDGGEQSPQG